MVYLLWCLLFTVYLNDIMLENAAAASPPLFVDVGVELGLSKVHTGGSLDKGYIVEAKGGGTAIIDVEGDGDLDIYWVNGATLADPYQGYGNVLYRNERTYFSDVTEQVNAAGQGWGMGAISADYDNDGDADLYITSVQENILYRNDTGRFVDRAGVAGVAVSQWSTGAAFADYDLDGDLDLYVANYVEFKPEEIPRLGAQWNGVDVFLGPRGLSPAHDVFFRNNGDGTFSDATVWTRLAHPSSGYGLGVLFADYDLNGYPDIFVANDSSPNFLYRNRGDGRFTDVSMPAFVAYSGVGKIQAGMGVSWGDYNADSYPDIFVTHFEGEYNTLYRNEGGRRFTDVSDAAGLVAPSLSTVSFGTGFLDYDNDADLDIFVANGHVYPQIDQAGSGSYYAQSNQLLKNRGDGTFSSSSMASAQVSRGSCIFDYDNDGDLDIFVANLNAAPTMLRNDAAAGQHWLGLQLVGRTSNRDGVGSTVRLLAGGQNQFREVICGSSFLSSEDPRLHFGLKDYPRIDTLEVRWPSGSIQYFTEVPINQYLLVQEGVTSLDIKTQE